MCRAASEAYGDPVENVDGELHRLLPQWDDSNLAMWLLRPPAPACFEGGDASASASGNRHSHPAGRTPRRDDHSSSSASNSVCSASFETGTSVTLACARIRSTTLSSKSGARICSITWRFWRTKSKNSRSWPSS